MSRIFSTLALLLLAAPAQGMTPARQDANSSGGQCPQAQAEAAAIAAPTTVPPTVSDPAAPSTTAATPIAPKRDTLSRPTAATRWHSFLPGMFK